MLESAPDLQACHWPGKTDFKYVLQELKLTSCKLEIQLLSVAQHPFHQQLRQQLSWLRDYGVAVSISIDDYSVPRHQARHRAMHDAYSAAMTQQHFNCLMGCTTALTACALSIFDNIQPHAALNLIACLGNLTKLHLTIGTEFVDLQALARLGCLEDLALQCIGRHCCHGVGQQQTYPLLC